MPGVHQRALLLATVLLAPLGRPTLAQELEPRSDPVIIDQHTREDPIALVYAWRFQPGDDPAWADPDFDDSDWPLVQPSLSDEPSVPGGWPGIGWFRRRIRTAAGFGDTLGIHMAQAGASEIYLDGSLVASFGKVSTDPAAEETLFPQYVASFTVTPGTEQVLAVRYSNVTGNVFNRTFRGFELRLGGMQSLSALGIRMIRRDTAFMSTLAGIFGAFTLLHLLLFAFNRSATENLYFAVFTGSMLGTVVAEIRMGSVSALREMLVYHNWAFSGVLAMALAALLLEHRVFRRRIGPLFYLLLAAALGALIWIWSRPALGDVTPAVAVLSAIYLVTLWHAILALVDREPEAWVIGLGLLALTLGFLVLTLIGLRWISIPPVVPASLGLGVLTLCFSVYLTRRVARTNRELAAKLAEVEELTARTIEQERQAAHDEAERRVLEADYRRKTAELEEARELQLAMLPRELPRLERYAVAVHMSTANEVGGDYYDFSTDGNGSCTLAVGDATGHGLHAGMVVGAAKSLFQTCTGDLPLSTVLRRIGEGLASMHRRQASMAMMLLRLGGLRLDIASAGMPPALVWRRTRESVEEVLLPSVPLGTLSGTPCAETRLELQPGDAVLLMTDGLAEILNPEGDPLGWDRSRELFGRVAHLEPEDAVVRLVDLAAEFRAETPLHDDMTLVVLKAR